MPAPDKFKKAAVVAATKIPIETLNRWDDRKIVIPDSHERSPGKGHPRSYVLPVIYRIAIGHALTKLSIAPTTAMALASKFEEPQRGRDMGKVFELGRTLLVARSDGTGSVVNLQPEDDVGSLLTNNATVIVNINKIIADVNSRIKDCK